MSSDVGPVVKWAVSERGKRLSHTEADVEAALKLLVLNGGGLKKTIKLLEEEGIELTRDTLRRWRDECFPRLYMRIRHDLGREVGKEIAGRAFERALQADEVEKEYIDAAQSRIGEVDANHLARSAQALSMTKSQNIEKAQVLRHEPSEIVETRDVGELVSVLERLKVAEPALIDAEVVEG